MLLATMRVAVVVVFVVGVVVVVVAAAAVAAIVTKDEPLYGTPYVLLQGMAEHPARRAHCHQQLFFSK